MDMESNKNNVGPVGGPGAGGGPGNRTPADAETTLKTSIHSVLICRRW